MRKILSIVISIILVLSSLFFVNLKVFETSIDEFKTYYASEEFINEIKDELELEQFIESVPFYQNELRQVFDEIEKSPQTKAFAENYSKMMFEDIIYDTYSFDAKAFIDFIVDEFELHLSTLDNKMFSFLLMMFKPFISDNIDDLNLESYYVSFVNEKKVEFSKIELSGMRLLYHIYGNLSLYKNISFILMTISFGLLLYLNLNLLIIMLNIILGINVLIAFYVRNLINQGMMIELKYYSWFGSVCLLLIIGLVIFRYKKTTP